MKRLGGSAGWCKVNTESERGRSGPPAFITATLITAADFNLSTDGFAAGEAMAGLLEAICPHGQKRTSRREQRG